MGLVPGDFTRDKSFSSSRALVIEEDSVTCKHAVGLAVIDHQDFNNVANFQWCYVNLLKNFTLVCGIAAWNVAKWK